MEDIKKLDIVFKEIWDEDCLILICGISNALGGIIYIGKNDDGVVLGVKNAKKLLQDIKDQVLDIFGLILDINLHTNNTKDYLEIIIPQSIYPLTYKGDYYYRNNTTTDLDTSMVNHFNNNNIGISSWDSKLIDNIDINSFYTNSFELFKNNAYLNKRVLQKLDKTNKEILSDLDFIKDKKLIRAAVMLFYQNPEKFINGAYIKIAYFETNSDIGYMDEIHGSLIEQAYRSIDLIFTKYLKAHISYDGVKKVKTYPYPKAAIREAVYNAIVHKNYLKQIPIQISVYKDKLYISNDCVLPFVSTIDDLKRKNRSDLLNPNIAYGFFKAGLIENKGLGIEKICKECREYGIDLPKYTIFLEDIMVEFSALNIEKGGNTNINTDNKELDTDLRAKKLLNYLKERPNTTQKELANYFQVTTRTIERQIKILKDNKKLVRVGNNRKGYWVVLN